MPNITGDGFIDPAQFVHAVALLPGNSDYALQGAVESAIITASLAGAFTCTVTISSYSTTLVQLLGERLVNLGYTFSLSSTVLTVNW